MFQRFFHFIPWLTVVLLAAVFGWLGFLSPLWWIGLAVLAPFAALGLYDLLQRDDPLRRNYPLAIYFRYLFEQIGPYLHRYIVESPKEGAPFDKDVRFTVYERARREGGTKAFGSELDFYAADYSWIQHSIAPQNKAAAKDFRVEIGGAHCSRPYSASVLNISAMSFGALGSHAVMALNAGAKMGGFAHDTGEGGYSKYHRKHGGDIIWEVGPGYFGCRTKDGGFDAEQFAEKASEDQVKMVELKLSQGAKPGHGSVLPAAKVNEEIAEARGVPAHEDCISPNAHSVFSTPKELLEFVSRMRELAGGKPAGFKLCVGQRWEILAICKAMLETGMKPDFIVVDGAEGGTGAAPYEFPGHVGMPLAEGLSYVHNALVGCGLRNEIRLAASGKILTGFSMAAALALGADWCNSARGFMFSLGCVESKICHTGNCPTGVTTHDPFRQRAISVEKKAGQVCAYHRQTVEKLAEIVEAAGFEDPSGLEPHHLFRRVGPGDVRPTDSLYPMLSPNNLLEFPDETAFSEDWQRAQADSFRPAPIAA